MFLNALSLELPVAETVKRDKDRSRLVIVPDKREIPKGTLFAILEQAGLTEEFIELLKN